SHAVAAEDGMLTSAEIASLDMSSARLVVLSACETGLGKLVDREGVLGLRRAFQVAGAQNLVMTLWPVEDEATREWISHFYAFYLKGRSAARSSREASLEILRSRRANGRSTLPFYWGAFVDAGGWR
ncbi:MAG TPA: CHAT domain-containing protein, partial [Candidatus Polarisedimenticolia bacterium]|nr:CHAT domain-containing protein [Candidatus Polarisedimenticolia bacterium]